MNSINDPTGRPGRILGLDFGSRTVGVAVSDELLITAQPLATIERNKENQLRKTMAAIEEICREYSVEKIVIGFPKNMDNSVGEQAKKSMEFADNIGRRTGLPTILWDERMTTISATRVLDEGNVRKNEQKQYVDKVAATFILQSYLDSLGRR